MGICGGAGAAHTPTYTGPLLAVDLFSVESSYNTCNCTLQVSGLVLVAAIHSQCVAQAIQGSNARTTRPTAFSNSIST